MSVHEGEIVEVWAEGLLRMGRVRVGGALASVVLSLVPGARPGQRVLVEAGVAVARIGGGSAGVAEAEGSGGLEHERGTSTDDRTHTGGRGGARGDEG